MSGRDLGQDTARLAQREAQSCTGHGRATLEGRVVGVTGQALVRADDHAAGPFAHARSRIQRVIDRAGRLD